MWMQSCAGEHSSTVPLRWKGATLPWVGDSIHGSLSTPEKVVFTSRWHAQCRSAGPPGRHPFMSPSGAFTKCTTMFDNAYPCRFEGVLRVFVTRDVACVACFCKLALTLIQRRRCRPAALLQDRRPLRRYAIVAAILVVFATAANAAAQVDKYGRWTTLSYS